MTNILVKVFILALIGSVIGYVTNVLAIKLLFRPYKEIRIPIINFKIQGVIPMRQKEIAKNIGEIVDQELVSISDILDGFVTEEKINGLLLSIQGKLKTVIDMKMSEMPLLAGFKGMIFSYIDKIMEEEGQNYIKEIIHNIGKNAQDEIKINEMVEEKINSFDLSKLEELAYEIARKELRHIEVLGGVLGFMIGIVQGIVVHLF